MAPRREQPESYGSIAIDNSVDEESVPLVKNPKQKKCSTRVWVVGVSLLLFVVLAIATRYVHRARFDPVTDSSASPLSASPLDMDLLYSNRRKDASPSEIWGNISGPLPTNSWYLVSRDMRCWLVSASLSCCDKSCFLTSILSRSPSNDTRISFLIERQSSRMSRLASILFLTLSTRLQRMKWRAFEFIGLCVRQAPTMFKWWTTLRMESL